MTIQSDRDLLHLLQAGEQSALTALYDRYATLVYSVALRVLKNSASAEDITQEVFIQIWNRPEQICVAGQTLHGFMLTASRNRSIDLLRLRIPDQLGDLVLVSPSSLQRQIERCEICQNLLALLKADQRMLLEMSFFKELTHAEIAEATGWPLGTIKTKIRRALANLKTSPVALERPEFNDGGLAAI